MSPKILKFTIPGEPKSKGRPRFRNVTTHDGRVFTQAYTDKNTENYENRVTSEFCRNYPEWIPTDKCIGMQISAFFPAPKATSKKKMHFVENETLRYPKKVDYDNLAKIVCDALNKVAYQDDKQITECQITKRYSLRPRTEVTIELLEEVDDA